MPITAKANTGGQNFEIVPAGSHIARCYAMIELGTIEGLVNGEMKKAHKVRITWELPLEKKVFKPELGEQPFSISQEYTLSMHEKSNLRKDLSSWRGRGFTDDEASSFDITKLLGVPCMINVVHNQSKSGNTYAKVAAITPIPKGMQCPPQINLTTVLSYDSWNETTFQSLPEWLRTKMAETPEYKAMRSGKTIVSAPIDKYEPIDKTDDILPF